MMNDFDASLSCENIEDYFTLKSIATSFIETVPSIISRSVMESCIYLNEKEQMKVSGVVEYATIARNTIQQYYFALPSYEAMSSLSQQCF